jgi:hypothetical protein
VIDPDRLKDLLNKKIGVDDIYNPRCGPNIPLVLLGCRAWRRLISCPPPVNDFPI